MTEPTDRKVPLLAPTTHPKRDVVRAAIEAVAGTNPITGAIARVYQTTHPSRTAQERSSWETATTDLVNEHGKQLDRHEDILAPKETITGLPAQLIAEMMRKCPDGLGRQHFDLEGLCCLLSSTDRQSVEDAASDLEAMQLVNRRNWIGGWTIALSHSAYEQLDRQLMDWDSTTDAIEIARLMAARNIHVTRELHGQTGWSKRRFNPAFRALLPIFQPGLVSREIQPDYPAAAVALVPDNKAALRRFLAKVNGKR